MCVSIKYEADFEQLRLKFSLAGPGKWYEHMCERGRARGVDREREESRCQMSGKQVPVFGRASAPALVLLCVQSVCVCCMRWLTWTAASRGS